MATITRAEAINLVEEFYKEVEESGTDDLEDEGRSDPKKMSNDDLAEFIMANELTEEDDVVAADEIDEEDLAFEGQRGRRLTTEDHSVALARRARHRNRRKRSPDAVHRAPFHDRVTIIEG